MTDLPPLPQTPSDTLRYLAAAIDTITAESPSATVALMRIRSECALMLLRHTLADTARPPLPAPHATPPDDPFTGVG